MIEPLDRSRRDSTLFQFTTRRLRDFIDPNHLLIRIDRQLDFAKLVAPLADCYCPDFGRPAIHPEVMVRALLIGSVYNIASFRRLCSAISENLAYRWFCFLTIDDPVFDHSSISHFIDRIGRDGFATIFEGLNEELFRLGMLSPEMYADASLVKANASSFEMVPSGMTVAEFQELAVEENGLFVLTETSVGDDGVENEEVRHFQDPKGRLPLNPVDTDARWRTSSPKRPAELCYQDNVIVDLGGFIVARGVTHASQGEWKAIPQLLEQLPIHPVSLTMDTGYSAGELRQLLEDRGIKAYIPLRPIQKDSVVGPGGFIYHGDWLVCPQGKELHRRGYNQKEQRYMYTARREDCQACPIRNDCLPPRQKRRYVSLTRYYPMTLLARERNQTSEYRRERVRRQTIAEGAFASLDRLGWARTRLRGLWKVNCEGYLASFAHNVLKMVRKLGRGVGPPDPLPPADAIASGAEQVMAGGLAGAVAPLHCLVHLSCWVLCSKLALR